MSVGSWLEVAKLIVSDSAANDHFGWPVALSGDRAAVGVGIDNDVSYMVRVIGETISELKRVTFVEMMEHFDYV